MLRRFQAAEPGSRIFATFSLENRFAIHAYSLWNDTPSTRRNTLNALWQLAQDSYCREDFVNLDHMDRCMAEYINPLVLLLSDEDTQARKQALWFLKRLALSHCHELVKETTEITSKLLALLSDQDARLRIEATEILESIFLKLLQLPKDHFSPKRIRGKEWIQPLVFLLSSEDTETRKRATRMLLRLILNEPKDSRYLQKSGGIALCVFLLRDPDMEIRRNTSKILALFALISRKKRLIINAGGLSPLVSLLSYEDMEIRRWAAEALYRLAKNVRHQERMINAGSIPPLVALLSCEDMETRRVATAALELLSSDDPENEVEAEETQQPSPPSPRSDASFPDGCVPVDPEVEDLSYAILDLAGQEDSAEIERTTPEWGTYEDIEPQREHATPLEMVFSDHADSETEEMQQTGPLSDSPEQIEDFLDESSNTEHQECSAEAQRTTPALGSHRDRDTQGTAELDHLPLHHSEHTEHRAEAHEISLGPFYASWDTEGLELLSEDIQNKEPIGEAGGIRRLLSLLSDEQRDIQRLAVTTLRNLAWDRDNQQRIIENGGIEALVSLLSDQSGDGERQPKIARVYSSHPNRNTQWITTELEKFWPKGMKKAEAYGYLTEFCLEEMESTEPRKQAAIALLSLSLNTETAEFDRRLLLANIRKQAAETLYSVASHRESWWLPRDINVLLSLLSDTDVYIRRTALKTLKNMIKWGKNNESIATSTGIQSLVSLLSDPDTKIRAVAVEALYHVCSRCFYYTQKFREAGGIELLVSLLSDRATEVRREAAKALQSLAWHRNIRAPIAIAGAVRGATSLMSDDDTQTRRSAVDLLSTLASHLEHNAQIIELGEALLCALSDQDEWIQKEASSGLYGLTSRIEEIKNIKTPWTPAQLVPLLSHKDAETRAWAIKELVKLTYHRENREAMVQAGAIKPLVRFLSDPRLKTLAIKALYNLALHPDNQERIRDAGRIGPLVSLLSDEATEVQENATRALCTLAWNQNRERISEAGGIRLLGFLRTEEDPMLREHIIQLFGDLTCEDPHDEASMTQGPRL